jgi:hypothetical protein
MINQSVLPVSVNASNSNSAVVSQLQAMVASQAGVYCAETNNRFFLRDGQSVPVWNPKKKLNQRFLFCWFFKAYIAAFADERLILAPQNKGLENIHFSELSDTKNPNRFSELGNISGSYEVVASRYPGMGIARCTTPALNGAKEYMHRKLQVQDVVEMLQQPVLSTDVEPSFYAEVAAADADQKAWNPVEQAWVYLKCFDFPMGPTLHDWDSMAKLRKVHTVALARQYQDRIQAIFEQLPGRVFYGFVDDLDFSISEGAKQFIPDNGSEPSFRMQLPNFMTGGSRPYFPIDEADPESLLGASASDIVHYAGVNGLPTDFTWPKPKPKPAFNVKSGKVQNPTIAQMLGKS